MSRVSDEPWKIDIQRLEDKRYTYDFEADSSFFESFEHSPVEQGKWSGNVVVEKTSTMLRVHFLLHATVELTCDRTLKKFDHPLELDHWITFKFGDEWEELDEDIWMIPWNTEQLNLGPYVFEIIVLALPMKRLHPDVANEDTGEGVMFRTGEEEGDDPKEQTDPRWEKLKRLRK